MNTAIEAAKTGDGTGAGDTDGHSEGDERCGDGHRAEIIKLIRW